MIWRQVWYKDLIHYVKCKTYISVYMYTNVVCIKLSLQCDHVLMIMLPAEPPLPLSSQDISADSDKAYIITWWIHGAGISLWISSCPHKNIWKLRNGIGNKWISGYIWFILIQLVREFRFAFLSAHEQY